MNLLSDDFSDGDRLHDEHAYARENESPCLKWSNLPPGTKELAVICDDPDAPMGSWVHWVLYGLPASVSSIGTGLPKRPMLNNLGGAKQGKNDFGQVGYDGPHPPPGPNHRYFFRLFALGESVDLPAGATAAELRKAMKGKILAEKEIVGLYSR